MCKSPICIRDGDGHNAGGWGATRLTQRFNAAVGGGGMTIDSVETAARDFTRRWAMHLVRTVLLVVGSLLFISVFDGRVKAFFEYPHTALRNALPVLVTTALALLLAGERYFQFIPMLRITLRSSSLGLLAYLLFEAPQITLANPAFSGGSQYAETGYYFVLALSAISLILPAFNIPVVVYILSTRHLTAGISGLTTSNLDIEYMLDMTLYLTVFSIAVVRIVPKLDQRADLISWQEQITFVAFGLHLGNYFWSGVAKALAGPHLWTWPMENHTENLLLFAVDRGAQPFGQVPWLTQHVFDIAGFLAIPMNWAIIGFQLLSVACVLRIGWLRIATIFYDLLHIGIYVIGGILFWPWIWNNFTILAATRSIQKISDQAKGACILTILLGCPFLGLYSAAWLAWFDVADVRQVYFEAVDKNNNTAVVPSSYFLGNAYGVSLGVIDTARHSGQYDFSVWTSVRDYGRQLTSGTCPQPPTYDAATAETSDQHTERLNRISRLIREHHKNMLAREASYGKFNYYYRIYHQPSNPYLFTKFNALNLKDIRAYNLVTESACFRLQDGKLVRNIIAKAVDRIDLP